MPKDKPMMSVLNEVFHMLDTAEMIPRFIRKAQGMLRREANAIRRDKGEEELEDKWKDE